MTVADVAPGFVALPNESGIPRFRIAFRSMREWGVPAPGVGARQPYAALQQVHGGFHAHAAARLEIVVEPVSNASTRIDQHDIQSPQRMSDSVQLALDVLRGDHITILEASKIQFHPRPKAP